MGYFLTALFPILIYHSGISPHCDLTVLLLIGVHYHDLFEMGKIYSSRSWILHVVKVIELSLNAPDNGQLVRTTCGVSYEAS